MTLDLFGHDAVAIEADAIATKREHAVRNALALQLVRNLEGASDVTIRTPRLGKGRAVLALRWRLRRGDTTVAHEVGAALCSPSDEFDLLHGIVRALGRLRKRPITYDIAEGTLGPGNESHIRGALYAVKQLGFGNWGVSWPGWAAIPLPMNAAAATAKEIATAIRGTQRIVGDGNMQIGGSIKGRS